MDDVVCTVFVCLFWGCCFLGGGWGGVGSEVCYITSRLKETFSIAYLAALWSRMHHRASTLI